MDQMQPPSPAPESLPLWKLVAWVFVRPTAAMRYATREGNVGRGLLLYVGVSLLGMLGVAIPYVQRGGYWGGALLIGAIALGSLIIGLFVYSGILHLVASLLGAEEGSDGNILSGICFASMPAVLVGPLALLSNLDLVEERLLEFLVLLLGGAVFLWIVALNVVAVREDYGVGRAVGAAQNLGALQAAQSFSKFSLGRSVAAVVIALPAFVLLIYLILFLIAFFSVGLGG